MLFSAGMGIGLVFWGVSEPVSHYLVPPEGIEGGAAGAARVALRYSFFHWGLHAWGIYTVIALALAYTQFRKKDSGLISSTFRPLIGHHADGPLGKAIDILAVIATVFGVATSLGLGTLQINAGLQFLVGIPLAVRVQLTIIAVVTLLYLSSAITGLERGIRYLSNLNLGLAGGLLLFVLIAGPTSFIFDSFTTTVVVWKIRTVKFENLICCHEKKKKTFRSKVQNEGGARGAQRAGESSADCRKTRAASQPNHGLEATVSG